jgi:hypothetical protein
MTTASPAQGKTLKCDWTSKLVMTDEVMLKSPMMGTRSPIFVKMGFGWNIKLCVQPCINESPPVGARSSIFLETTNLGFNLACLARLYDSSNIARTLATLHSAIFEHIELFYVMKPVALWELNSNCCWVVWKKVKKLNDQCKIKICLDLWVKLGMFWDFNFKPYSLKYNTPKERLHSLYASCCSVQIRLAIGIATRMKYWLWTEDGGTEKLVEVWEWFITSGGMRKVCGFTRAHEFMVHLMKLYTDIMSHDVKFLTL